MQLSLTEHKQSNLDWFVYVVRCADNSLYTGITTNIARRLRQHNGKQLGGAKYTRSRRPVKLAGTPLCVRTRSSASRIESLIKSLNKHQKETFIRHFDFRKGKIVRDFLHFHIDDVVNDSQVSLIQDYRHAAPDDIWDNETVYFGIFGMITVLGSDGIVKNTSPVRSCLVDVDVGQHRDFCLKMLDRIAF